MCKSNVVDIDYQVFEEKEFTLNYNFSNISRTELRPRILSQAAGIIDGQNQNMKIVECQPSTSDQKIIK